MKTVSTGPIKVPWGRVVDGYPHGPLTIEILADGDKTATAVHKCLKEIKQLITDLIEVSESLVNMARADLEAEVAQIVADADLDPDMTIN